MQNALVEAVSVSKSIYQSGSRSDFKWIAMYFCLTFCQEVGMTSCTDMRTDLAGKKKHTKVFHLYGMM